MSEGKAGGKSKTKDAPKVTTRKTIIGSACPKCTNLTYVKASGISCHRCYRCGYWDPDELKSYSEAVQARTV